MSLINSLIKNHFNDNFIKYFGVFLLSIYPATFFLYRCIKFNNIIIGYPLNHRVIKNKKFKIF